MQFNQRTLKIAGIAVGAVLVVLIALPLFININSFRPKIEAELTSALGRPVTMGELSLSLLSGTVGVDNLSIADDPAFSKSPFVTAKSLKVGVELMPLIFSKQLNITGIVLDEPNITLLKAANGTWNFSSLGAGSNKQATAGEKSAAPQNFSVGKLQIKDGKLAVGRANSSAKPQVYDKVNVEAKNFSYSSQFPFELTAGLPGGGNGSLSGKAGPINPQDAAKTPVEAAVKVKNMDLAASGFVDPASGIGGLADLDGTLNSSGGQAKAAGQVTCEKLKLSPKGTPAPKTVSLKYAVNSDLDRETGTVTQGDIAIGKALAHLTGGFQTQGESQVVNLKLSAPNMPVDELEAMLPAMGVVLPSGSQLTGGTLSADLEIAGPLDKLVITGPVRLANTKLAHFDLGSKLGALSAFTGKAAASPDTSIQNASLDARVAPEGTRADSINLNVPALGVITGAGTVSPDGGLNFKMLANLNGGAVGGLSKAAEARTGQSGIPFTIEGTTSSPKFVPDLGGAVAGLAKGELGNLAKGQAPGTKGVTKGLGRALGKKN
jgi:AsmA protein